MIVKLYYIYSDMLGIQSSYRLCFIISCIMTIVSVVIYFRDDKPKFCHYNTQLYWINSSIALSQGVQSAQNTYYNTIGDTCEVLKSQAPYTVLETFGDSIYTGSLLQYKNGCYDPTTLLIFVFAVSALFQCYRWLCFQESNDPVYCAAPNVHVTAEAFHIQHGMAVYDAVIVRQPDKTTLFGTTYCPSDGPQFLRWLEYAITSPMQLAVIVGTFYISEYDVIILITTLQVGLIMMGYLIELMIDQHIQSKQLNKISQLRLFLIYLFACMFHVVIWWCIIDRFHRQVDTYNDCKEKTKTSGMPGAVYAIVYGECFLFSLFGVVQGWQLISLATEPFTLHYSVEQMWVTVCWCYSILSVTAKTFLGITFLFYVGVM